MFELAGVLGSFPPSKRRGALRLPPCGVRAPEIQEVSITGSFGTAFEALRPLDDVEVLLTRLYRQAEVLHLCN